MSAAAPRLEFWFEFASTYSYLSALRIEAMAAERGVGVVWRPFLLGPIFASQGWDTSPFAIYPAKGRYMWRDMERLTAARGLPFKGPTRFPQHSLRAARVALAALDTPQGPAFCKAIYSLGFGEGVDISEPDVIAQALKTADLPTKLVEAGDDPMIKERLKAQTARAVDLGLFGAPSFTVGAELFWGDDRLEMALEHAMEGAE